MIKIKLYSGEILEGVSFLESYKDNRVALELKDGKIAEFSIKNIETIKEV